MYRVVQSRVVSWGRKKIAPVRIRTADLMITSHALYQLSYESSYGVWPLVSGFMRAPVPCSGCRILFTDTVLYI